MTFQVINDTATFLLKYELWLNYGVK